VRLEQSFVELITQVRGGDYGPMWIYGEMAGVLCRNGNHAAAGDLGFLVAFVAGDWQRVRRQPADQRDPLGSPQVARPPFRRQ